MILLALGIAYMAGYPLAAWMLVPWARRDCMVNPGEAALFFALFWPFMALLGASAWALGNVGAWLERARPLGEPHGMPDLAQGGQHSSRPAPEADPVEQVIPMGRA